MGFLSAWEQTERIDVSDLAGDPEGTWWVEIKKCLTHGEADAVQRRLMESTVKMGQPSARGEVAISTTLSADSIFDHQGYLIAKSIVAWNLTDSAGEVLPVAPFEALETSLARLPAPVYDRVAKVVVAANTETSGETGQFPDDGGRGDSLRLDRPSDDREVLV